MDRCKRTGCKGEIQDGFCSDCGLAPVGVSRLASIAVSRASVPQGRSAPIGPGGSVQVGSAAMGSAPVSSASSMMSGVTGSRSRSTGRSTGRALGAGFISLPPMPSEDPLKRILPNAVVPEKKRFCGSCQKKVTRESGFCPYCGSAYSFEPTLKAGDLVAGQYEVKGPIAFGGFGWIYLAQDTKLKKRWVVLKGLLNSKDAATAEAAMQEREFLSAVKHPNIVAVYNFATHGNDGYIVMEYVGGKTLGEIRKERGALPVAEALAYIHRVLAAFAYLEEQGLAYCDFKPPNAMVEHDVKLIDMGGVRRVVDTEGNVYGTKGFFAPEIGDGKSPSFVSDLYTVARTLAVLTIDFDFQNQFQYSLPTPVDEPLFATYDSFYRLLLKAAHRNPERRFQNAAEFSEQLLGVLRDVVAGTVPPRAVESSHFGIDAMDPDADDDAAHQTGVALLPSLKVDAEDPAANTILSYPSTNRKRFAQHFESLLPAMQGSMELKLRLADAHIFVGLASLDDASGSITTKIRKKHFEKTQQASEEQSAELKRRIAREYGSQSALAGQSRVVSSFTRAAKPLVEAEKQDPFDWRVEWYRGRLHLAMLETQEAFAAFERVYSELPGELGAKLGFAIAAEHARKFDVAENVYDLIARCDPGCATACFGLARCRVAKDDRNGAAEALARVPPNSNCFIRAQMELARVLIEVGKTAPTIDELSRASETLKGVGLEGLAYHEMRANLLLKSVAQVDTGTIAAAPDKEVLGIAFSPKDLRAAAENELRMCARYAKNSEAKIRFIEQANAARPWTLF